MFPITLPTPKSALKEERPRWFSEPTLDFGGRRCLNGVGPVPAKVLFVDKMPTAKEVWSARPYTSRHAQFFLARLGEIGFDNSIARFTYATKHSPKKYSASEVRWGEVMLQDEINAVRPDIVVCFGAEPLKSIVGMSYQWDDVHGAFFRPDSIPDCPFEVFATYNLEQVLYGAKWDVFFKKDLERIKAKVSGSEVETPHCDVQVIHTPEELDLFTNWVLSLEKPTWIMLDCEWHGKNWMDPNRYFRTIQMGYKRGKVITLEVSTEGGNRCYPDEKKLFASLKRLLESDKVNLAGHNIIADGEWLLSYGVDIRNRVKYDTMLAEHIIDQNGPFGLESLAMKYTPYGRYSVDVEVWVKRHKNENLPDSSALGYGYVPRGMLLSYGFADVDVLRFIMDKQIPILKERGCFERRGKNNEYPSLFDTVMRTQRVTYDLELNGLPVDMNQLDMLTEKYQAARSKTLSKVMQLARAEGFEDFNPRSALHLRKILFDNKYLGLTPVKTTDGDDWGEVVGSMGMDSEDEVSAATDKTTLQILEGTHPFVDALLDFRRIDQVCKTWLTKEKNGKPAGLYALLWPDVTLKPHYSPLTSTGRMRVSSPNSQNFPKAAESYLTKIFGEGNEPPMIRTIVKPRNDWIQIEADFCAAELNILGNLSQDANMLKALYTPGLDLHDKTAVDSFGLLMFDENGKEVTEDDLIRLAAEMGEESDDYQHFMKALTYVDKQGKHMTRAEMKGSIRIIAKSLNFGIAYGRGARAIALAVKAQTGSKEPLDAIIPGIAASIEGWKTKAYPTAWQWLVRHQQMIYDPGYVENAWGRRRYFHLRKGERNASMEREAGNFGIQSCCADSVQIAMGKLLEFKDTAGFPFRIQNQIHDALMVETPREHIEDAKNVLRKAMSEIDIPIPDTDKTFRLGVDIDVYERWGVKMK